MALPSRPLLLLAGVLTAGVLAAPASAATTSTFPATADAYVDAGSTAANFGTATELKTDGSPQQRSYFRFAVSGTSGAVTSAKLRLWVINGSTNGPAVFATDSLWSELGITWANAPAPSGASPDDKANVPAAAFVDYDVTPLVHGDGGYDFVTTTASSDAANVSSREDATLAHRPQLIVTSDGGTPPPDTTPPDTTITGGPPSSTANTTASFAFTSSETGSTFECRIDNGAWGTCTTPKAYSGLAVGQHTFDVRATDTANNTDTTPASQTWTITTTPPSDTTPPDTTIDSGPSGSTTDTSASFAFSSTETGSTFECRIDNGAWGACTSPKAYSGLAAGVHAFDVRATDAAQNTDTTPASRAWTITTGGGATAGTFTAIADTYVDASTATTNYGSAVALGTDNSPVQRSLFRFTVAGLSGTVTSAKLRVWATDGSANGPAVYATSGTWVESTVTSNTAPAPSGSPSDDKAAVTKSTFVDYDVKPLVTGNGTVNLITVGTSSDGTDVASREDATVAHRPQLIVTTDGGTPPPDTTPPNTTITSGPAASTADTTASFAFTSSETGSTFECRLDNGAWGTCTTPKAYSGLAVGQHTFDVRATDTANNTDTTPASQTWTITTTPPPDTTPPDTTITSGPAASTTDTTASFAFTSSETGSTFECRLDTGAWGTCTTPKAYSGLAVGQHTFDVRATDAANNTDTTPASQTWTITSPPSGTTVAQWHMDERSGSSMFDSVGNHTGVLHSVALGQTGWSSFAYGFNGSSSYADVANSSDLIPGSRNVTLTLHLKTALKAPSSVEDWDLMRKGLYASGSEFKMEYYPSGQVGCGFRGSVSYTGEHPAGPVLNDNQWHTIQCVKTGSQTKTIVDGKTVYTQTVMVGSITTTDRVVIGARPGSEYFNGQIDEVSIAYG